VRRERHRRAKADGAITVNHTIEGSHAITNARHGAAGRRRSRAARRPSSPGPGRPCSC
jgi:hypothetical protein